MNTEMLLNRIDELIALGNEALATERTLTRNQRTTINLDLEVFYRFRAASISFILKLYQDQHPYYIDFSKHADSAQPSCAKRGIGILKAIKNEIEKGWLNTTKGLISADIFGDFMEMAEHLIDEGYKDAAAVIIGSTLEQHLRTLAANNEITLNIDKNGKLTPKKADVINSELAKKGVYTKLDQKSVTFWLGLRNNAAHGNYDQYNTDQVKLLLTSVTEFMGRISV